MVAPKLTAGEPAWNTSGNAGSVQPGAAGAASSAAHP